MSKLVRILGVGAGFLGLLVVIGAIVLAAKSEDRPSGVPGPAAEALADRLLASVDAAAWDQTGAVRWRMRDGLPLHTWDRRRGLVLVDFEDGVTVALTQDGARRAIQTGGEALSDGEKKELTDRAWAAFINDSFWLIAPMKVKDPGTSRSIVEVPGSPPQLLVTYSSGGVTPGDAYLWELDDNGRPVAWKMWVGILPVGGVRVTWDEWIELPTGGKLARLHDAPLGLQLRHDPMETAATLATLVKGGDPFAGFLASAARATDPAPASRPAVEVTAPAGAAADGGSTD